MSWEQIIKNFIDELAELDDIYGSSAIDQALSRALPGYGDLDDPDDMSLYNIGFEDEGADLFDKQLDENKKKRSAVLAQTRRSIDKATKSKGMSGSRTRKLTRALTKTPSAAAGAVAGSVAGTVARAVDKTWDQQVYIAGQAEDLETNDEALYDLIDKTNSLINQTNDLLQTMADSITSSNKELKDLNVGTDYLASTVGGKSMEDVVHRQDAGLSPADSPELEEPEEETEEPPTPRS